MQQAFLQHAKRCDAIRSSVDLLSGGFPTLIDGDGIVSKATQTTGSSNCVCKLSWQNGAGNQNAPHINQGKGATMVTDTLERNG